LKTLPNPGILLELLENAGIRPKGSKKAYILTCPRCTKRDKLYIRKSDARFICFYCREKTNFQGAGEYALTEITGKSIQELRKLLYGYEGTEGFVSLDVSFKDFFDESDEVVVGSQPLPTVEFSPDFKELDSQWSIPGVEYLAKRGVSFELAVKYGIKYWPARSRIVFPVSSRGRLLGWQSRTIKPAEWIDSDGDLVSIPKSLTYDGLAKDRALMFADNISGEHAIVTEGPFDAIKADLCGGAVCTMGKAVSFHQINLLVNSGISKMYFGLDPDASQEVGSLIDKVTDLYSGMELFDMRPRDNRDLGDMTLPEVYDLFRSAPKVTRGNIFIYLKGWND